jgi:hypothetical protein
MQDDWIGICSNRWKTVLVQASKKLCRTKLQNIVAHDCALLPRRRITFLSASGVLLMLKVIRLIADFAIL